MATQTTRARRIRTTLLVVNGAGAVVAAGFGAAGLARPSIAGHGSAEEPNGLTGFWAASSAIRSWAVAGPLLAALLARRTPSPQLLVAAGIVQLGDATLGLRQRNAFMTVAPAVMGAIHLTTASVVSRR